ncbi:MAG: MBL fold metallo-hydrolase [Bacilli bacterium]|nr:MBL fold metallo-hydrolase [Bacilli bacterium]
MSRRNHRTSSFKNLIVSLLFLIILGIIGYFVYPIVVELLHEHGFIEGKCECGELDPNYVPPHIHEYIDGVCSCGKLDESTSVIQSDTLSIHFMELGNKYTGDSIYIKAGETDILIDAGSRGNSADDITNYLNQYVEDNTLEYVIATHAHQDHIAGFVGTSQIKGIFDEFICEVIIDFSLTNATSKVYQNYVEKRDLEVQNGATHYTALECYNNLNGASRKFELSDGIELEILYNYYYENKTSNENDYSVCLMINQNDKHFLFTGDLEDKGEEKLVEYNDLPEVELFKAGHHGSYTASTLTLLEVIKPNIVCVCCCCGSDEYTDVIDNMFPSQAFISRVLKYTEKIYVTSIISDNEDGFTSLNGNINIISDGKEVIVNCSNNNTVFKDTEWFKENRKWE